MAGYIPVLYLDQSRRFGLNPLSVLWNANKGLLCSVSWLAFNNVCVVTQLVCVWDMVKSSGREKKPQIILHEVSKSVPTTQRLFALRARSSPHSLRILAGKIEVHAHFLPSSQSSRGLKWERQRLLRRLIPPKLSIVNVSNFSEYSLFIQKGKTVTRKLIFVRHLRF